MRRRAILAVLVGAASLLAVSGPISAADRPVNVLFVATDDCNAQLACYGREMVKTPNMQRLAARSVKFDRAYCQYPLCSPSRVSLMTGLRPDTTRIYDLQTDFRKSTMPDVITLAQMFRINGYYSARVGKIFHYGVPGDIGKSGLDDPMSWDEVVNPHGHDKKIEDKIHNYTPNRGLGSSLAWYDDEGMADDQTDGVGASETIKLLEKHKDKPFFIACGFYRPHTPYVATHEQYNMYTLDDIRLPEDWRGPAADVPKAALWTSPPNWGVPEEDLKRSIRGYYASIALMDKQLGRLLDALDRLKLAENTVIVFWSDHGYMLGQHGQWMKQALWEQAARVPFMVSLPGARGNGKASPRTVELVDIYPTLADLFGLEAPSNLAGKSLRPLIDDPNASWDKAGYSQVMRGGKQAGSFMGYAVRNERWRYVEWDGGAKGVQLYDEDNDPEELHNLANDPQHAQTVAEMKALLHKVPQSPPAFKESAGEQPVKKKGKGKKKKAAEGAAE